MSTAAVRPQVHADVRNFEDVKAIRAKVLYDNDAAKTLRKSHENPSIKRVYSEYLGEPGSEKAHHILHTTYVKTYSELKSPRNN